MLKAKRREFQMKLLNAYQHLRPESVLIRLEGIFTVLLFQFDRVSFNLVVH